MGEVYSCSTLVGASDSHIAASDPDTMYFHQAMQQNDAVEFLNAAHKEFQSLLDREVIEIIPANLVPTGMRLFSAVWSMKRKRQVKTREVYKHKARLNLDGSQMQPGKDYDLTYAPVATWESIRVPLALVLRHNWKTKQLDYVFAFPQAPVERECYMRIPKGIVINATGEWALRVERNIYGQKQAGRVWNEHLVQKLTSRAVGFKQSKHDDCLFYHGKAIYVLYTDDSILAGPHEKELNNIIERIKSVGLDITEEGEIEDFLGVNIDRVDGNAYHLSQPQLIAQIIQELHLNQENVTTRPTPATHTKILGAHLDSPEFDGHFHYRSIIGKLNHLLERGSRPDISYAVRQCARFSCNPRKEHGEAVKRIGRYLMMKYGLN
jgi:hypothetical protein